MLGTAVARLHRWARHRTVGAKNAAVARLGLETLAAALAIVEELASVSRHRFHGRMVAMGADYRGFQMHRRYLSRLRDHHPTPVTRPRANQRQDTILIFLEV